MRNAISAAVVAVALVLSACSGGGDGEDDLGPDAGEELDERQAAIAYCNEVAEMDSSDVEWEDCCFVDQFAGEERDCTSDPNTSWTVVLGGVDGCAYGSDPIDHPDGSYVECVVTACEPC